MRLGVHLPLMDFGDSSFGVDELTTYVETATALGFDAVAANDHLVFAAPWLDGPAALAAVASCSGSAGLWTTVANPVVRGPVPLAKSLGALDLLSGGRLVAALGPGSSEADYATVGVPFAERWPRFDEAVRATRAALSGETFEGRFYECPSVLEPRPTRPEGPPLWVASWGSEVGLRRAARLGDGWLASAYNTTPEGFAAGWARVRELREAHGGDPAAFGNALATMWFHVDARDARRVLDSRLAPVVHREPEELASRLAFGSAEEVAAKLAAFRDAGVQRMFLWPVADELEQLRRVADEVVPLLAQA
jgi:alkanesulfonate monooxygenase SsuD/methylene tetrahydromethanopterin reductase-like flavin-dependent oxidoreductase (luciferase family)